MTNSDMTSRRPGSDEYYEYYAKYIQLVPDGDLRGLAEAQIGELRSFFQGVSEQEATVLHAPYTWTIKQVLGHLIDAERIFGNRIHRFASGDFQPLPGMEQDPYVANNDYELPTLQSLLTELILCREANVLLLRRIKPQAWEHRGVASDHPITVRALAYVLVGHILHHLKIVAQRLGRVR
jgi:hypothetical protein